MPTSPSVAGALIAFAQQPSRLIISPGEGSHYTQRFGDPPEGGEGGVKPGRARELYGDIHTLPPDLTPPTDMVMRTNFEFHIFFNPV